MKKNAFTVIELIATIMILGIVIGISATSYLSISKATKEQNRTSLIKRIEIAAEQYAEDYGINKSFFVQDLIDNGYLVADNGLGELIDPTNQKSLNCYAISISVDNNIVAKFIDKEYLNCNSADLELDTSSMSIDIKNAELFNGWYKSNSSENIKLVPKMNDNSEIVCNNNCEWTSDLGVKENIKELEITSSVVDTKYYFNYNNIMASETIKIDNEKPTITKVTVDNETKNVREINISVLANDGNGSGVKGYYLKNYADTCSNIEDDYNSVNDIKITENGEYSICVADKVLNITKSDKITVNNIIPNYKIKYFNNGILLEESIVYEDETILSKAPNISNTDVYEFSHWEDSSGNILDSNIKPTKDDNYYAKIKYKVIFMDGDNKVSEKLILQGSQIGSYFPNISKEDYEFDGWYTKGGTKISDSYIVNSSQTLYVRWKLQEYDLEINASNGIISNNNSNNYKTKIERLSTNTYVVTPNTNYMYSSIDCNGGRYDSSTNILTITNPTTNISCNIYFKENNLFNNVKDCLTNYNNPCYVRYGFNESTNYDWIVYGEDSNNNGIRMILKNTAGTTIYSSDTVGKFTRKYIGLTTLTSFYNKLPSSKSDILIDSTYRNREETANFSYSTVVGTSATATLYVSTATSNIGIENLDTSYNLLDYNAFRKNVLSKTTWTSTDTCLLVRTEECISYCNKNGSVYRVTTYYDCDYMLGIIATSNNTSCDDYYPSDTLYYRPTIVMKNTTPIKSGIGTESDPFIVQ